MAEGRGLDIWRERYPSLDDVGTITAEVEEIEDE